MVLKNKIIVNFGGIKSKRKMEEKKIQRWGNRFEREDLNFYGKIDQKAGVWGFLYVYGC